jgi:membrane-bound lytic murein transglycosylase A
LLLASGCATLERPPACPPCAPCPQCPPPKPPTAEARYEPAAFSSLPGWRGAELLPSARAFAAGCARIPPSSPLANACRAAEGVADEGAARRLFEENFAAYALRSPEGGLEGLVTGYYEPILVGGRARTDRYRYPVYGVPQDLVVVDLAGLYPELRHMRLRGRVEGRRIVPYYSRAEIDSRGTSFGAPVLAWVEDPVELFFLQIQGSGQVRLESGEVLRLGYADQNGHPYRSLGRALVERGEMRLEDASMQGIKAWALAHPEKLSDALNVNASYVFFREREAGAPVGALGAPLTPGYSIAADRRFVPLGAPVYLATTMPASDAALERLVVAQDTGGAIRGAVRADLFWGSGPEAGAAAGRMRQQGRMWLLWPKELTAPGGQSKGSE